MNLKETNPIAWEILTEKGSTEHITIQRICKNRIPYVIKENHIYGKHVLEMISPFIYEEDITPFIILKMKDKETLDYLFLNFDHDLNLLKQEQIINIDDEFGSINQLSLIYYFGYNYIFHYLNDINIEIKREFQKCLMENFPNYLNLAGDWLENGILY